MVVCRHCHGTDCLGKGQRTVWHRKTAGVACLGDEGVSRGIDGSIKPFQSIIVFPVGAEVPLWAKQCMF